MLGKKILRAWRALTKRIVRIWWTLVRWIAPRFAEIKMEISEPLEDGDYVIGHNTKNSAPIKVKNGKIYRVE